MRCQTLFFLEKLENFLKCLPIFIFGTSKSLIFTLMGVLYFNFAAFMVLS